MGDRETPEAGPDTTAYFRYRKSRQTRGRRSARCRLQSGRRCEIVYSLCQVKGEFAVCFLPLTAACHESADGRRTPKSCQRGSQISPKTGSWKGEQRGPTCQIQNSVSGISKLDRSYLLCKQSLDSLNRFPPQDTLERYIAFRMQGSQSVSTSRI